MTATEQLAAAYLAEGLVKGSIALYKRVLDDRERELGPTHPDTIAVVAGLAAADREAGRMAEAVQLYERACADSERHLGADHRDTLIRCAHLAHT